jgi:Fe-S-cluster containining protein
VKVDRHFPEEKIPKDENGEPIWIENEDELLIPKSAPESVKLKTYRCLKYDKESGRCLEYEKRPEICRASGCVDKKSSEDEETQYRRTTEEEFWTIKKTRK